MSNYGEQLGAALDDLLRWEPITHDEIREAFETQLRRQNYLMSLFCKVEVDPSYDQPYPCVAFRFRMPDPRKLYQQIGWEWRQSLFDFRTVQSPRDPEFRHHAMYLLTDMLRQFDRHLHAFMNPPGADSEGA